MFALLFLITEHRFGSHSGVGCRSLIQPVEATYLSRSLLADHTPERIDGALTSGWSSVKENYPSAQIPNQVFMWKHLCVDFAASDGLHLWEKEMDGHGMEVVRYIWLQKIANVTLVATRSCNTHIQMLSLNGSRILQKGFHHMRCNILMVGNTFQSDPAAFWSLKAASLHIFLALWWHRFLKSEKDPQLRQQPLLFVIAHCLWSVRIFAYLAITLCRSVGFLSGSFN